MLTKFKTAINDSLAPYKIAGFGFFRDWIIEKSGVELEKGKKCRFLYGDAKDTIHFRMEFLTEEDIRKVEVFLKTNSTPSKPSTSKTKKEASSIVDIPLNDTIIYDYLLPLFKADIRELYNKTPEKLKVYQLLSQDVLESNYYWLAIDLIEKIIKRIEQMKLLDSEKVKDSLGDIFEPLTTFSIRNPSKKSDDYECIYKIKKQIDSWIPEHQEVLNDNQCHTLIQQLKEALTRFEQFNRQAAKLKVTQFFKEIDTFLAPFSITTKACDIFDEFLFKKANLPVLPRHAQFGQDRSRINFTGYFYDPSQVTEQYIVKFVNFFKEQGDETAYLTQKDFLGKDAKDKEYPSYLDAEENIGERYSRCRVPDGCERLGYDINVSGEMVADKLFAQFKEYINNMAKNEPVLLEPYQKASQKHFKKETAPTTTSKETTTESKSAIHYSETAALTLFGNTANNGTLSAPNPGGLNTPHL